MLNIWLLDIYYYMSYTNVCLAWTCFIQQSLFFIHSPAFLSLVSRVLSHFFLVRSDITTLVSFIFRQGGSLSPSLCRLAPYLWHWCLQRQFHLSASLFLEEDYLLSFFLSRGNSFPPFGCWSFRYSFASAGSSLLLSGHRPVAQWYSTRSVIVSHRPSFRARVRIPNFS